MQRISWNQCVGIFAVFVSLGLAPAGATDKPVVVKLWPGKPPGPQALVAGPERDRQKPEDRLIAGRTVMKLGNVAHPEMHVFVPPREKANGAACVVCPGGGFSILAWDLEGTEVAEWLNSFGVAAVVLKYRVPTRQHGWPRIWQGPVMDAQRALSLVRSRAMMWRVDPKRIGILGFSAGGATAALTAVKKGDRLYEPLDEADKQSCAANFAILVYPGGITDPEDKLREEYRVDTNTPPMFFAHAADDRVKCEGSAQLFLALKKAKVPAELHIYRDGGHGYGLRADWPRVTHWPREARGWLHDLGLLTPPRSPADRVRTGNPADHLPPYVRQITWFGERPDWSHDGQRILFVGKPFGDVFEYDLATGRIRPITLHFKHQGFTRALYLANGDILLSGPNEAFDVGDKQAGNRARDLCWLSVLDKDLKKKPVSLGALCAEGPAVSRRRLTLAWTQRWRQKPQLGENRTQLLLADLEYIKGVLRLVKQRVVFDSKQLPFEMGGASLETQNLVPPDDRLLTFSAYQIDAGTNTETFIVDTKTGAYRNLTRSPDRYDEPEGVFPDGKFTLVESAPSRGKAWPLCDLYKLNLDGSGAMQRLTHFSDFPGFKGTQGVISDDGRLLCYQIGKRGDEAGVGYGLFLMDLQAAARHLEEPRNLAKSEHPLQILADEYVSAWKKKRPLPQFTQLEAPRKLSLQEAYQVQRCWVKQTLDRSGIGGVKGAVVTPGGQKALAIGEPLGAFLRASGRFEAKDEPTITLANWISMGIETEIGFVIGKTIDTRLETVDDFKKHIRAIVPMIELPAGAWEHKAKPTAADVVAINVNAAAYIVGTEVAPTLLDPGKVTVAFTRDGKELHRATGAECWKGPWETGHWLANFAWRQGIELRPGQVILCGALGKVHPGTPGRYVADYGDLGKIVFQLK